MLAEFLQDVEVLLVVVRESKYRLRHISDHRRFRLSHRAPKEFDNFRFSSTGFAKDSQRKLPFVPRIQHEKQTADERKDELNDFQVLGPAGRFAYKIKRLFWLRTKIKSDGKSIKALASTHAPY